MQKPFSSVLSEVHAAVQVPQEKNLRSRFLQQVCWKVLLGSAFVGAKRSRSRKKQKVASDAVLTKATVCKGALDPAQSFPYGCEGVQPSFPSHRPHHWMWLPLRIVWLRMREHILAKSSHQEWVLSCELSTISTISIWGDESFCPVGDFWACITVSTTKWVG